MATTRNRSGKRLTTSSVVTPTEPVEPSIERVFMARTTGLFGHRLLHPCAEAAQCHQREVVRVQPVAQIKMSGEAGAGELVFIPRAVLVLALDQPLHSAQQGLAGPL